MAFWQRVGTLCSAVGTVKTHSHVLTVALVVAGGRQLGLLIYPVVSGVEVSIR